MASALLLTVTACNPPEPPDNSRNNELTMRQQLIELFQTAEVAPVPNLARHYLIRDKNGAIWFMRADHTDESGTVMLFPGRSNIWALPMELRQTNATQRLGPTNKIILEDTK